MRTRSDLEDGNIDSNVVSFCDASSPAEVAKVELVRDALAVLFILRVVTIVGVILLAHDSTFHRVKLHVRSEFELRIT